MTDTEFAAYLLTIPYPPVPALAANATQATIDAAAALAAEVALPSYRPVPQPPVLPREQGSEAQFRRYTAKQAT
jgi:hypothetical protein